MNREKVSEPSAWEVLFAVEEAIRNGECPWEIEHAFQKYEAARLNEVQDKEDVL